MKYILILLSILIITGCERRTTESTGNYYLPSGLEHCKVYRMESGNGSREIMVVHCPNSSTTTTHVCGKNCQANNTVIEE